MKPLIFPLLALVATGTWYHLNASKIADLKGSLNTDPSTSSPPPKETIDEEKSFMTPGGGIELDRIENFLGKVSKGEIKSNGNNAWLWIEQQFNLMSGEDLLAFMDDLEHADFPLRERNEMMGKIKESLINLHPELYLRRFGVQTGFGNYPGWRAFHRFMDTDKAGAIAWFDGYVEETKLGEREISTTTSVRVEFERIIARELYPDDLEALQKRIKNLNEDQAYSVISSVGTSTFPQVPQHYLNLVRSNLPEEQAAALIGNTFANATRGKDLAEVTKTIDEHHLMQTEKNAFYRNMVIEFAWNSEGNIEQYETMLPLLKNQGVGAHDEIYAAGLAKLYSNELCGKGDLTKIYSYVHEAGTKENLKNLFPTFVDKTTSQICECCSLKGRLKRISDESLKDQISAAYQSNLNQTK